MREYRGVTSQLKMSMEASSPQKRRVKLTIRSDKANGTAVRLPSKCQLASQLTRLNLDRHASTRQNLSSLSSAKMSRASVPILSV